MYHETFKKLQMFANAALTGICCLFDFYPAPQKRGRFQAGPDF